VSHHSLTGGTGTLGHHVTPLLLEAGYKVRMLSRHANEATDGIDYVLGDLVKGEGIEAAVGGAEIILHLAGGPKGDDVATKHLIGRLLGTTRIPRKRPDRTLRGRGALPLRCR
jgi:nucleoside-diphosphate-sugar epimerase